MHPLTWGGSYRTAECWWDYYSFELEKGKGLLKAALRSFLNSYESWRPVEAFFNPYRIVIKKGLQLHLAPLLPSPSLGDNSRPDKCKWDY